MQARTGPYAAAVSRCRRPRSLMSTSAAGTLQVTRHDAAASSGQPETLNVSAASSSRVDQREHDDRRASLIAAPVSQVPDVIGRAVTIRGQYTTNALTLRSGRVSSRWPPTFAKYSANCSRVRIPLSRRRLRGCQARHAVAAAVLCEFSAFPPGWSGRVPPGPAAIPLPQRSTPDRHFWRSSL